MSSVNRELILHLVEGFNTRNSGVFQRLYAPEFLGTTCDGFLHNGQEAAEFLKKWWLLYPDCSIHVNCLAADGELVGLHYSFLSTSSACSADFAIEGSRVCFPGAVFSRIQKSLITEQYFVWNKQPESRAEIRSDLDEVRVSRQG
jgi:predicted ester cyclase